MPNQSHNLIIVPMFPGSLILSKTNSKPEPVFVLFSLILKTAKQSFAEVKADIFLSSLSKIRFAACFFSNKFVLVTNKCSKLKLASISS